MYIKKKMNVAIKHDVNIRTFDAFVEKSTNFWRKYSIDQLQYHFYVEAIKIVRGRSMKFVFHTLLREIENTETNKKRTQ